MFPTCFSAADPDLLVFWLTMTLSALYALLAPLVA